MISLGQQGSMRIEFPRGMPRRIPVMITADWVADNCGVYVLGDGRLRWYERLADGELVECRMEPL